MVGDVVSRTTLRHVRDIMAGAGGAQAKLNDIVVAIAEGTHADVCSIYLSRRHELLELFATKGLDQQAVHNTTLKFGEGLTGQIARRAKPLRLRHAQISPDFAYRPETGEEAFTSFMGVPVLYGGNVIGVLSIQHRLEHGYGDDEVEALEIIAMVVAEMVAGVLIPHEPSDVMVGDIQRPRTLEGLGLVDGVARGQAVFHQQRLNVARLIAEDGAAELIRLEEAVLEVQRGLNDLQLADDEHDQDETLEEMLETMRMFAADKGWVRRMRIAVEQGLTAEAAVERVHHEMRARLLRQPNLYFRERIHDLDDLADRMFRALGGDMSRPSSKLQGESILIARSLGPAQLLEYDRSALKALVVEEASPTSHVVILARALGIPVVGQTITAEDVVREGDVIVVDGERGQVHVRPAGAVLESLQERVRLNQLRRSLNEQAAQLEPVTLDGRRINCQINAGLVEDVHEVPRLGADGVGLFRTELHYMIAPGLPKAGEEVLFYQQAMDAAGGKPVTFRTLDLGGDKLLPYAQHIGDENPALGWRAIRICLDRPTFLKFQLRTMMKAADGRPLRIMFPMVASLEELQEAAHMAAREADAVARLGHQRPQYELGVMVEVPSLLEMIPQIAPYVSFLAVGTNDLMQFLYAADRGNARVANRYGRLPLGLLRVLARLSREAPAHGLQLSVCGEMAGRPEGVLALMLLGITGLSMSAASLPFIKQFIRASDVGALQEEFQMLLEQGDPSLASWLEQHVHVITSALDEELA